jgi:hypothetical protein
MGNTARNLRIIAAAGHWVGAARRHKPERPSGTHGAGHLIRILLPHAGDVHAAEGWVRVVAVGLARAEAVGCGVLG